MQRSTKSSEGAAGDAEESVAVEETAVSVSGASCTSSDLSSTFACSVVSNSAPYKYERDINEKVEQALVAAKAQARAQTDGCRTASSSADRSLRHVESKLPRRVGYGDALYWELRFQIEKEFEWLAGWEDQVRDLVLTVLPPQLPCVGDGGLTVLVPGVGTSRLAFDVAEESVGPLICSRVICTDIASSSITRQQDYRAHLMSSDKPAQVQAASIVECIVADSQVLSSIDTGTVDLVIEKGLLDAVVHAPDAEQLSAQIVRESARVVKKGGYYVLLSLLPPAGPSCFDDDVFSDSTDVKPPQAKLESLCVDSTATSSSKSGPAGEDEPLTADVESVSTSGSAAVVGFDSQVLQHAANFHPSQWIACPGVQVPKEGIFVAAFQRL